MWETSLYQINHNFYFFDLFRDIPRVSSQSPEKLQDLFAQIHAPSLRCKTYKTFFFERDKVLTWKTHTVDHNSNTIKYQKAGINFMVADLIESK